MSFPQPIFQLRGTQLKPYYSRGGSKVSTIRFTGTNDAVIQPLTGTGVFGSSVIDRSGISDGFKKLLCYDGRDNLSSTGAFTIVIRIVPNWTGSPSAAQALFVCGTVDLYSCTFYANIKTNGNIFVSLCQMNGSDLCYGEISGASFTSGTPTDLMFTWTGVSLDPVYVSQDSGSGMTLLGHGTVVGALTFPWTNTVAPRICLGYDTQAGVQVCNHYINELAIFDSVLSAYPSRTDFFPSPNLNGDTMPSVGNVLTGVTVGLGTGTAVVPSPADTRLGVPVGAATGTAAIPAAADTRKDIPVDHTVGVLDVPPTPVVLNHYVYDNGTKTGQLET